MKSTLMNLISAILLTLMAIAIATGLIGSGLMLVAITTAHVFKMNIWLFSLIVAIVVITAFILTANTIEKEN